MNREKVSAAIICVNEEDNIARCIESVRWADEVVVLDSGSKDRTLEIAQSLGARCFSEPWRGFTAQKNRLAELCQYDWIFNLDADEACPPSLRSEIEEFLAAQPSPQIAVEFPRKTYYLGRWIAHGGWYPDRQRRLYNRTHSSWAGGSLHEKIQAPRLACGKAAIEHWVFKDLSEQVSANNRYSSLGADNLFAAGKRFSLLLLVFKPIGKFLETYIYKRGFLDGMAGFVISVGAAYSMFLKFAKLYYLEKAANEQSETKSIQP